jgi:hypothetical protein
LFVQVTVSPTLALMVAGLKAKPAIVAVTVPASVDGAHASVATPLSEAAGDSLAGDSLAGASLAGASLAGAGLAGAGLVAVPPEQADTIRSRTAATARERVRGISVSSWFRVRGSSRLFPRRYAERGQAVS